MGLMGHPIADAYQTMMAERVEVLRGPASVLYGSNAMGGVINIVTRKMQEDGIRFCRKLPLPGRVHCLQITRNQPFRDDHESCFIAWL